MDLAWLTGKAPADHIRATRPGYYLKTIEKQQPKDGPEGPSDHH